jgi:hypothetical protein
VKQKLVVSTSPAKQADKSNRNNPDNGIKKPKRARRTTEAAYWRRRLKNAKSQYSYEVAESDMLDCAVDDRQQKHTVNVMLIFDDNSEFDTDTLASIKRDVFKRNGITPARTACPCCEGTGSITSFA